MRRGRVESVRCPKPPGSGVRVVEREDDEDAEVGAMTSVWLVDQLDDARATEVACERVWRAYTRGRT